MRKRISYLLMLVIVMTAMLGTAANANTESVMWTNISSATVDIDFSGSSATATGMVTGKNGTTYITGTITVYLKSGNTLIYIASNSGNTTTRTLTVSTTFTPASGAVYVAVFSGSVTANGTTEPFSISITR